jgi:hypothetical protein
VQGACGSVKAVPCRFAILLTHRGTTVQFDT